MTVQEPAVQADSRCSFCRKGRREAGLLVEGPGPGGSGGVFICRHCAVLCLEVLEAEQQRREDEGGRGQLDEGRPRGRTIAGLIRELRRFEDQTLEVRLSFGLGETSHPISLVGIDGEQCLILSGKDEGDWGEG
jgi:hypothetical protein